MYPNTSTKCISMTAKTPEARTDNFYAHLGQDCVLKPMCVIYIIDENGGILQYKLILTK